MSPVRTGPDGSGHPQDVHLSVDSDSIGLKGSLGLETIVPYLRDFLLVTACCDGRSEKSSSPEELSVAADSKGQDVRLQILGIFLTNTSSLYLRVLPAVEYHVKALWRVDFLEEIPEISCARRVECRFT